MYCVVKLKVCGTKLIVKRKQCEILSAPNEKILNRGLRANEKTKIFISSMSVQIDFSGEPSNAGFDPFASALYDGCILHCESE